MPKITVIVNDVLDNYSEYNFTPTDKTEIQYMLDQTKNFKGVMDVDSIGASVYTYWHYFFYKSLFTMQTI